MTDESPAIHGEMNEPDVERFAAKARDVAFADLHGRGFLEEVEGDVLRRLKGHVRLPVEAMDGVSLYAFGRNGAEPGRWLYKGPVYRGDAVSTEELEVYIVGYGFSGEGVRAEVASAPPRR
jgi:hypothetical protein